MNIDEEKAILNSWINREAKRIMYNLALGEFTKKLNEAIKVDNISIINELMSPEFCEKISSNKKEELMFDCTARSVMSLGNGTQFLKYLIFDYKISEENSISKVDVDENIKRMFETRKLNEELELELKNDTKNKKKIKI